MADEKITSMGANTTPDKNDLLHIIDNPAGTPTNEKIKLSDLFPTFDVLQHGATDDLTTDDASAIQAVIDLAEAAGGGTVLLAHKHLLNSALTIDSDCVTIQGRGGNRNISAETGTRIDYGGSGSGIILDKCHSVSLLDFRIENVATGTIGIDTLNIHSCFFRNVHVREFDNDNWLLECDTTASAIYNEWVLCSGFKADKTANGIRMLEGSGKAVNQNVFLNCDFSLNNVGIQQDSECNDNVFIGTELGSCVTCAVIRGRTHFDWANMENATTGLNMVSGSAAVVSGSIHFGSNTTDISNSGNRPIPAILHGGTTSSGGWSVTGAGYGFRGATPPSAGGWNLSTNDGDPILQRAGATHFVFESGNIRANQDFQVANGKNVNATAAKIALPTATTTELEGLTDDVNTNAHKVQGSMYWNITTDKACYSAGSADNSLWLDSLGATLHTPV